MPVTSCLVHGVLHDAALLPLVSRKLTFKRIGTLSVIGGDKAVAPVFTGGAKRTVTTHASTGAWSISLAPGWYELSYNGPDGIQKIKFPVPEVATLDFNTIDEAQQPPVPHSLVTQAIQAMTEQMSAVVRGIPRTSLQAILLSDTQVLYYDERMPEGTRYSQPDFQDALFVRMKERHPLAEAMFHCGDIVDRPNISASYKAYLDTVEPGNTYQVGAEYPAGITRFLLGLAKAGWDLGRFFYNFGNHEFPFGLYSHFYAWSARYMEEALGAPTYHCGFGNVYFLNLSDRGGGTTGQLAPQDIEWADFILSQPAAPTKRRFILKIHQPIRDYGPAPLHTVLPAVTVAPGQTVVEVGPFPFDQGDAFQLYEGPYAPDNVPLEFGIDYTVNATPKDANGNFTTITLAAPYGAEQVLQARLVSVDAYQDQQSSDALLALLAKHHDKIDAVFYGHRQQLWNAEFTNIRAHPEYGTLFVNNNMALNNMGLPGGLDPITNPVIYTVLEWTVDPVTRAGTLVGRRYNDTAGDWLENTHPDADHTFTINYDFLDLGRVGEFHDSRRALEPTPPGRQTFNLYYDIMEGGGRTPDGSSTNQVANILMGRIGLLDASNGNVKKGSRLYLPISTPQGSGENDATAGGRLAWPSGGGPSRESVRLALEVENESDTLPRMGLVLEARTGSDDTWRELFRVGGQRMLLDAKGGIGLHLLDGSATLASLRTAPTGADGNREVMFPITWEDTPPSDAPLVDGLPAIYCQGFHLQRRGGVDTGGSTTQIVFQSAENSMNAWFRGWTSGAFTGWRKLLHDGNIVVESGSGPTGEFLKFANGRMLCRRYYGDGDAGLTFASRTEGAITAMWAGTTWAFPAAFSAVPAVQIMGRLSAGSSARLFGSFNVNSVSITEAQVRIWGLPADIDNVKYLLLQAEGPYA